ncbi:MAG TPA: LysE family transporter [Anaerolineae bacterium]
MPNLYPFLAYVFVTTFTPGPNNILSMSNGTRFGYRRTLGFLAGISAGFCVVLLACGLLNVVLVSLLPQVRFWLNFAGAVYMVYLAVHILRSAPVDDAPGRSDLNSFGAGFILQFLNLKGILYGVTVYAMFITPAFDRPLLVSLFAPLLAAVAFVATSCWSLGGDLFRHALRRHYRFFNFAMAALLIYTAVAGLVAHR